MKSATNWRIAQQLESTFQKSPQEQQSLKTKLSHLWQTLLAYLTPSLEPRVWLSLDVTGRPQWNAYDPVTGKSTHLASEDEMRIWLEKRHYSS